MLEYIPWNEFFPENIITCNHSPNKNSQIQNNYRGNPKQVPYEYAIDSSAVVWISHNGAK